MGRGAGAAIALVVGAVEILDLRIALIEVKVKVAAAIGADQQAGKHIVFSIVGATLTDFAPLLLHLLIHSTLDDRLMDVLEHHPILTVIVDPLLILVGFGISFERILVIVELFHLVGGCCLPLPGRLMPFVSQ